MQLSGFVYRCSGGETFDSIAFDIWGDEKYAADLLCANPEYCARQVFLGGEELHVPVVEISDEEEVDDGEIVAEPTTAPWRE